MNANYPNVRVNPIFQGSGKYSFFNSLKLCCKAIVLILPSFSWAADPEWVGTTNSDFSDPSNWNPNGVPSIGAIIDTSVPASPILSGTFNIALTRFTVGLNNMASLLLDGNGTFTITNPSVIGSNVGSNGTLTLQNGASFSNQIGFGGGSLTVGETGTGTVNVTGGGTQIDTYMRMGINAGGSGTLNILNGGNVTTTSMIIGGAGTATINVDGPGSSLLDQSNPNYAQTPGTTASVNITNGGVFTSQAPVIGADTTLNFLIDGANSLYQAKNFAMAIGSASTGSLTVTNGGRLLNDIETDFGADGNSTVLIRDTGSHVDAFNVHAATNAGSTNTITVQDGALLTGYDFFTGGGNATVNVTGANSSINLNSFTLASNASGQTILTVANQGQVEAGVIDLGDSGQATVTVDGAGSRLFGSFLTRTALNPGSTASITITNQGLSQNRSSTFGASGNTTMVIDNAGSLINDVDTNFASNPGSVASLTLQSQGKLTTGSGVIANFGQATAVIDGIGTEFVSSGRTDIGNSPGGVGTVTVQNGGLLNINTSSIGNEGVGNVTVTGAGSTVYYETGTLGALSGGVGTGLATNQGSWIPFRTVIGGAGTGNLTIEGLGSRIDVGGGTTIGEAAGGVGTLTVKDQATGTFDQNFTPDASLVIGKDGQGDMFVQTGATVTSADSVVGGSSQGSLMIEDLGSSLTGLQCRVGNNVGSDGTVTVHNNGTLALDTAIIGNGGTGRLIYDGAGSTFTVSTGMTVGNLVGGNGTLRVISQAVFNSPPLIVGAAGTGNVVVENANSSITGTTATLGDLATGDGTVTVHNNGTLALDTAIVGNSGTGRLIYDGAGSTFTVSTGMTVGNLVGSNGTFTVINQAVFNSPPLIVGAAGTGNVVVENANSSITGTTATLGDVATGEGTITVQDSGSLGLNSAIIANAGKGTLIIDGAPANLTLATNIVAGKLSGSNGTVILRNGASFISPPTTIGEAGRGRLIIQDLGSSYTSATNPYIGLNNGSNGGLTLQSDGTATATEFLVAVNTGSIGSINIGDEDGNAAAAPGTLVGDITFGNGTGTAYFNHTSGNYIFSNIMNGPGRVIAKAGTTHFPNPKNYTGQTLIQGGTLIMDAPSTIQSSAGVNISSGTFDISAGNQVIQDLSGSGGTVILGDYRLEAGTANSTNYAGLISGTNAGELEKKGNGALRLTGANTYSGTTRLTGGFIGIGNNAALGTSTVIYNGGKARFDALGLTVANDMTLSASGLSTFDLNNYDGTLSGVIDGINTSTFNPTNTGGSLRTITLTGINTLQGNMSIGPNTRVAIGANGTIGTAAINLTATTSRFDISSITPAATTIYGLNGTQGTVSLGSKSLIIDIGSSSSYGGTIQDGGIVAGTGGKIIKTGNGELILTRASNFTGGVDLTQGTLTLGDADAAGTGPIEFKGNPLDTRTLKIHTTLNSGLPNDIKINADSFLDTQNYNITINGSISGSSALTKLGTGTLTLNGANTFVGSLLQSGDIRAGNNQALGAGAFTFASAGTRLYFTTNLNNVANTFNLNTVGIIHTGNNRVTITGPINGNSNLIKEGPGILELSNANNGLNAEISIQEGEVKINGIANTADVVISNGSRLTGNFTVQSIMNNGTVKPGNSIGAAQVLTDYDNTNGTYACEVNDAGDNDFIEVNGTATLGGDLYVIPQPGNYSGGITYTILSALNNPLIGTFATVTGLSPLLRYVATYDANNVYLTVTGVPLSETVKLGNPGKVAAYVEQLGTPLPGSILEQLLNLLPSLNEEQIYNLFNQLHPATNGMISSFISSLELSQSDHLFAFSHMDRSLRRLKKRIKEGIAAIINEEQLGLALSQNYSSISSHLNSNKLKNLAFPSNYEGISKPQSVRAVVGALTFWLQQGGSFFNHQSNRDESPTIGVAGIKGDVYSTLVGFDRLINSQVLIGAAFGYNRMSYRLRKDYGDGKIDSYRLGLYGIWEPNDVWYFNAAAFMGYHNFKGCRHLALPTAKLTNTQRHGGYSFNAIIEAGRDILLTRKLTLTPYAALGMMRLTENGYTESGQGINPRLKVNQHNSFFWQAKLGGQLSHITDINGTPIHFYGKMGYIHKRYEGYPQSITASFADQGQDGNFKVFPYQKPKHLLNPGIGAIALLTDEVNISANYSAEIDHSQCLHQAQLRLDYRF